MNDMKDKRTNIIFKNLIMQLYGKNDYYRVKNKLSITKAKKYYIKILETFRISINETIKIVDKNQIVSLNSIIEQGKERIQNAKTFDSIDNTLIEIQTILIFQLIGLVPNRFSQKNVPNRKEFWSLDSHRQIQYVQDNKQKERLIFSLIQSKYSDRFPDFMTFFDKIYMGICNNNLENLFEWLKENHPEIYHDII